jgi:hypothetical protein
LARAILAPFVAAAPSGAVNGAAPPSPVIAEFTDQHGLLVALRQAHERRDISYETLDEIVGAPKGYFSKVLSAKSDRKITMQSLGWAMNGLGVRCLVVDDPAMLKQIASRMKLRDKKVVRTDARHIVVSLRFLRKIAAKGGEAYVANHSPTQRRRNARKAALARWHRNGNGHSK